METLDDSTKDPWNQTENGTDGVDNEKVDEPKKAEGVEEEAEKKPTLIASIRSYNCSIGKDEIDATYIHIQ